MPFTDTPDERRALIALSLVPGVGPGRIRQLVRQFGSAGAALEAPRRVLATIEGIGEVTAEAIVRFDGYDLVADQWNRAAQVEAELVAEGDPRFPIALGNLYDPPAFLWVRGALVPEDERAVAIVGTRKPSEYGKRMAERFAGELAERGYTIVSGLAYGIDTIAHTAALQAGGRSLTVLGSGVDWIYPTKNAALAARLIADGAILSEYPLGARPDAVHFPRRNRIVSGLAKGTVVIEAYEKGGALITAGLALEQNREVFAVPSAVTNAAGAGCNRLIQRGHAKLVQSVEDILAEIDPGFPSAPDEALPLPALHPVEERLYEVLTAEPVHVDTICARTGLDPSAALVYLLSLEFKGLVFQMAGKQFYRSR
jgi:DNA processing protein